MRRRKAKHYYVDIPKKISHRMRRAAGTYIAPSGGNSSSYKLLRRFRPSMFFDLMAKLSGK